MLGEFYKTEQQETQMTIMQPLFTWVRLDLDLSTVTRKEILQEFQLRQLETMEYN